MLLSINMLYLQIITKRVNPYKRPRISVTIVRTRMRYKNVGILLNVDEFFTFDIFNFHHIAQLLHVIKVKQIQSFQKFHHG